MLQPGFSNVVIYRNPRLTVKSIKGRTALIYSLLDSKCLLLSSSSLISPSWPRPLLIFEVFLLGGPSSPQSSHHLAYFRCLLRLDSDSFHNGQKAWAFSYTFPFNRLRKAQLEKVQGIVKSSLHTFDLRILFFFIFYFVVIAHTFDWNLVLIMSLFIIRFGYLHCIVYNCLYHFFSFVGWMSLKSIWLPVICLKWFFFETLYCFCGFLRGCVYVSNSCLLTDV